MVRSISRERRKRKQLLGTLLLTIVLVIFAAIIGVRIQLSKKTVGLNKQTLCPEHGPIALTVILVDRTDAFNTIQRAAIRVHLEEIKGALPKYACIQLYTLAPIQDTLLTPKITICNPGRGEEINPILGNQRLVERKWKEAFSKQLNQVFEETLSSSDAQTSPIMEALQSVSITAFSAQPIKSVPKKLIIVSDMLQHTHEFSQYTHKTAFKSFQQTEYYRKVRPRLHNVEVQILYLRRSTQQHAQGKQHIEFWQQFISDSGGILSQVLAVEG